MKLVKSLVRKTINVFNPGFEQRHWDRQYIRGLNRKPPELMWEAAGQYDAKNRDGTGCTLCLEGVTSRLRQRRHARPANEHKPDMIR